MLAASRPYLIRDQARVARGEGLTTTQAGPTAVGRMSAAVQCAVAVNDASRRNLTIQETGTCRSGGNTMKSIKRMALGVMLVGSLVGVSSASAATWDPQNTTVTGTSTNTKLTDTNGNVVSCTSADTSLRAVGDLSTAQGASPVNFSTCTNSILPSATTTVTTAGTWTFTATNATTVDATAVNPSGPVATIHIGGICTITVPSPVHIPANGWNNTTHQLTINSAVEFGLTKTSLCLGVASGGSLSGTFTLPSSVVIT
jgi:hypothetical protein